MRILVSNNHLHAIGGSETATYTLAAELYRLGHEVDILTKAEGIVSDKLTKEFDMKVNEVSGTYDLCLLNHNSTVRWVLENLKDQDRSKIIQTCHGVVPGLESPHGSKDIKYVGISAETFQMIKAKGLDPIGIVHNGIDLDRFYDAGKFDSVSSILSLSHSRPFNVTLQYIANRLGVKLVCRNKFANPIWEIENVIAESQLVFGLGRSAFESLAMGKSVFVGDGRNYMGGKMDGIISEDNIESYLTCNCSGRYSNIIPTAEIIMREIDKNLVIENNSREIAEEFFDIKKQVQKYLKFV